MTLPHRELAEIDKLVHEPARLSILTALLDTEGADFRLLLHLTGLQKGNLSTHLMRLEEADLIRTDRSLFGKKTRTMVELTERGRSTIERYLKEMERLHEERKKWSKSESKRVKERVLREGYGRCSRRCDIETVGIKKAERSVRSPN